MSNIILIGMPGVGKSTVGVVLAKAMGFGFIDTDLLIQTKEGRQLYRIIEQRGSKGFLALENEVVSSLWAERCVIATGGSVIYGADAMKHLKTMGKIVYLQLDAAHLIRRVKNLPTRGIVMKQGESLEDLYQERAPLYEKYADVVFPVGERTIEETVLELQHML